MGLHLYPVVVEGNRTGKVVIPPKYESAFSFSEGLAVAVAGGKGRYIDRKGKVVLDTSRFDEAKEFEGGLARIKAGSKIGYIDKTGRYVWKPTE